MSWDTTKPGDSDVISQYPANERALRAFLESIFGVDHESTVGGTQGYHNIVRMLDLAGTPAAIAGGILYVKEFEGQSELYYLDSAGNEIRMTYRGELVVNLQETELIVNSLRTRTFFRGRALDLEINSGQVVVDWEAATLFRLNLDQNVDVSFINMPDTSDEEEQTIIFEVLNGGDFVITTSSPYLIEWTSQTTPTWTSGGKDYVIATSHDGLSIQAVLVPDFGVPAS